MSSLLAGSLTPMCARSTVATPLISAAGASIQPGSSEDGFGQRGDGTVRDTGTALHDYGSPSSSCSLEEPLFPGPRSDQDPRRPNTLFMPLQSKHPNQTNTASCLHTATSALRISRQISSLRWLLCSLHKASFAGDVAKRIIIYRRLLFPKGNLLNTQFCIALFCRRRD